MLTKKGRWILTAVSAAAILVLSLVPQPPQLRTGFRFIDKVEHIAAYLVLGFLVCVAFTPVGQPPTGRRLRAGLTALVLVVSYGALIEFLQQFTHRDPELMDLVADLVGAFCGAAVAALVAPLLKARKTQPR